MFEKELNLQEIPWRQQIITVLKKVRRSYSKSYIPLYNAVPKGTKQYEVERLKNTYGYLYKRDRRYNSLYVNVYGNVKTFSGVKY